MKRDLTLDAQLDWLLAEWHHHSKGYMPVPTCGADPMFRNAKSGKGWDSVDEIIEDELSGSTMRSIDHNVNEMTEPHRSAIYCLARNCYTGANVWMSPRLPKDRVVREGVVKDARRMLTVRLVAAGVM